MKGLSQTLKRRHFSHSELEKRGALDQTSKDFWYCHTVTHRQSKRQMKLRICQVRRLVWEQSPNLLRLSSTAFTSSQIVAQGSGTWKPGCFVSTNLWSCLVYVLVGVRFPKTSSEWRLHFPYYKISSLSPHRTQILFPNAQTVDTASQLVFLPWAYCPGLLSPLSLQDVA